MSSSERWGAAFFFLFAVAISLLVATRPAPAEPIVVPPECAGCHPSEGLRDTTQTIDCGAGACHGTTNITQISASHPTHLNDTGGRGPSGVTCDTCHGAGATTAQHAGHLNGRKNFIGANDVLSTTGVCASCHSSGGAYNGVDTTAGSVGAKNNWATGVYSGASSLALGKETWCVGCHDASGPTLSGRLAPNIGGDGNLYGFFKSGHGLDVASKYDGDSVGGGGGNDGADQDCSGCHEFQYDHIDGTDNTNTVGQRLKATINGSAVTVVQDVCKNCHQVNGELVNDPSKVIKASAHGNQDAASTGGRNDYTKIEPLYFSIECLQCHDPHSGKLNAEGTRNLRMIRPDVVISRSVGTTGSVVFTNRGDSNDPFPGTNSFDETDTEESDPNRVDIDAANNNDDLCVTCHVNSANPGWKMTNHTGAFGHDGGALDNRGKTCPGCHTHTYGGLLDSTYTIDDGFMPDVAGLFCGSCHATTMVLLTTGSHDTHFRYYYTQDNQSLKGPGILVCDVCHGVGAGDVSGPLDASHHEGHQNTKVNFGESSETVLALTGVCNNCHSPGGAYNGVNTTGTSVGAKNNWVAGVYSTTRTLAGGKETWCVGCHDESPSVVSGVADNQNATNTPTTTMTAANMGGNETTYGAFASGHSKASGTYDATTTMAGGSGNPAAAKGCDDCHNLGVQHLNRSNDTSMAGQRITEVNNVAIGANAAPSDVCDACHQTTGGPDSAVNQVSNHGNTGEGYTRIETSTITAISCDTCHEGHGLNKNANNKRNLRMVKDVIKVAAGTTSSVVFERTTGLDSFDESDAVDADDVCAVCHSNPANPGSPMLRHNGGNHTTADTSSIFYQAPNADKRDKDCSACHRHDYKEGSVTPDNGWMPAFYATFDGQDTCLVTDCHAASIANQSSGRHTRHFAGDNKGPNLSTCDTCHGVDASPSGAHTGHDNGTKNFADNNNLAATVSCNTCHSPAGGYNGVSDTTIGAKNNWTNGVYLSSTTLTAGKEKWCVGCHDNSPSLINISGTTMTAPNIGGNSTSYGFYFSGHGLSAGNYSEDTTLDVAGNTGAAKRCENCHDLTITHLNTANDTGTSGQRIQTSINSLSVSTVADVCKNCHQVTTGAPATNLVKKHGNSAADGFGDAVEAAFSVECAQCHDPHSAALNSAGGRNLKMVRPDVLISSSTGTTGNVVFESHTGTNSFDEPDNEPVDSSGNNDDICPTCHSNANNPGYAMTNHYGGWNHSGADDKRGQLCITCHSHVGFGTDYTVADGFMPAGCDSCHGQPPLAAADTTLGDPPLEDYVGGGGAHLRHKNALENLAGTNLCRRCHDNGSIGTGNHNEDGDALPKRTNIDINFYSAILGNTTGALGYAWTSIDNGAPTAATATLPAATATPTSCSVGCHNPRRLKPVIEPTSEGLSNVATWTVRSIACVKCHDSQGKMVDSTTQTTQSIQGVTYLSGHDRVNTSDATDPTSGARLNRQDCLACHYNKTGVASQDGSHTRGTVVVRNPENTGTPITWDTTQSTQESLCLGCHDGDGMPAGAGLSENGSAPPDIEVDWTDVSLDSTAAHRGGGRTSKKFGCLGDASINGTGCHGSPHGSAKPHLLGAANISGSYEEKFCLGCHNATSISTPAGGIEAGIGYPISVETANNNALLTVATSPTVKSTPNGNNLFDASMVGKYFKFVSDSNYTWRKISAVTDSTNIVLARAYLGASTSGKFFIRNKPSTHPVGEQVDKHNNNLEQQAGAGYNWNRASNRHVECLDCHNVHRAGEPLDSDNGSSAVSKASRKVWGVDVQYQAVYTQGGARFTSASTAISGAAKGEPGDVAPNWGSMPGGGNAIGWRIKNNYDKSGAWYTVTGYTSPTAITISPSWNATWTAAGAFGPTNPVVDYTMVKVSYAATNTVTQGAQICLKCHSSFAFSTGASGADSPPESPSGMWAWSGTSADLVYINETEVGADFAPTHLATHGVMALGKNQPIKATGTGATTNTAINPNWPDIDGTYGGGRTLSINTSGTATFSGTMPFETVLPGWYLKFGNNGPTTGVQNGWYQVVRVISPTQLQVTPNPASAQGPSTFSLTAGLGNNFVPPFGPWARTVCTNCHAAIGRTDGPHGSSNKWNLVSTTTTIAFRWWDGAAVTTITPNNLNVGATSLLATPEILCFNCHRRDVYGDVGVAEAGALRANFARIEHAPDAGARTFDPTKGGARWGDNDGNVAIICMTCHGGDSLGGLHGSSSGKGYIGDAEAHVGAGVPPLGANNRGERFLNGATWIALDRATTATPVACWTKSIEDDINSCGAGHAGTGGNNATYDY